MLHPLDAIALASLRESVLVKKLAALWCRQYGNSAPTSGADILAWVKEEYGDVLRKGRTKAVGLALGNEVKRQLAVRKRRKEVADRFDHLELPASEDAMTRRLILLHTILGPPRKWIAPRRFGAGAYNIHCINSGLVAGLIPTNIKLRRVVSPTLLVYRQSGDRPRSYWVPGGFRTLSDALVWLIPEKAHRYVKMDGVRVEHDGRHKKVRLTLPDGTIKKFGWRKIGEG
jgi:hypothetical protein